MSDSVSQGGASGSPVFRPDASVVGILYVGLVEQYPHGDPTHPKTPWYDVSTALTGCISGTLIAQAAEKADRPATEHFGDRPLFSDRMKRLRTTPHRERQSWNLSSPPRIAQERKAQQVLQRSLTAFKAVSDDRETHTLNKLADAATVPRFSLHDLRATGNTWLANANVDERIRQYLLGHHAGGPVIDRYTKITTDTEKQLREAVVVFDTIRASK